MRASLIEGEGVSLAKFADRISSVDTTQSGLLAVHKGVVWENDEEFLRAIAEQTPFHVIPSTDGPVANVIDDDHTGLDRSHRSDSFDWHQDGAAKDRIPDFGLLYCVSKGSSDNITTAFTDTTTLLGNLTPEQRALAEERNFVYVGRHGERYPARPLVDRHPYTGEPVMHVGDRVELPVKPGGIPSLRRDTDLTTALLAAADASLVYDHKWQQGDAVVWDNHRLGHARVNHTGQPNLTRKLRRVWLTKNPQA